MLTMTRQSVLEEQIGTHAPGWDDTFVDELRRSGGAIRFFCILPVYIFVYLGFSSLLVSQAGAMTTDGYVCSRDSSLVPSLTACIVQCTQ